MGGPIACVGVRDNDEHVSARDKARRVEQRGRARRGVRDGRHRLEGDPGSRSQGREHVWLECSDRDAWRNRGAVFELVSERRVAVAWDVQELWFALGARWRL